MPAIVERTTSDGMPASELNTASGRLNARKSTSASGRSMRKGRAMSRVVGRTVTVDVSVDSVIVDRSACAIASAEWYRSSGRFSSARWITPSIAVTEAEPVRAAGCPDITA